MAQVPDFDDPRPVFLQIADDLRRQIEAGQVKVGTRMPSQTELAKRYGVAANTLRAALKELVDEGLVSTQSTRGTFVLKKPGEPKPSPEFELLAGLVEQLVERIDTIDDRLAALETKRPDHPDGPPSGPDDQKEH